MNQAGVPVENACSIRLVAAAWLVRATLRMLEGRTAIREAVAEALWDHRSASARQEEMEYQGTYGSTVLLSSFSGRAEARAASAAKAAMTFMLTVLVG